jgi:integrase/recombinase XerD
MQIRPETIRLYLLWLEETDHNKGGCHAAFRALRAFLLWWENEVEPEGWRNPIKKVKAPKVGHELLDPVPLEDIKKLVEASKGHNFTDIRDRAIFICLLDTGARAGEFLALNLDDVEQSGAVYIRHGKGNKGRIVYLGQKSRKALRAYIRIREDNCNALWVTKDGERLGYDGLRAVMTRRAGQANVDEPNLHSFRRAFALNMLRAGVDIYSLQKLMGHADLSMLRRYLNQTDEDIRQAHAKAGPVDHAEIW